MAWAGARWLGSFAAPSAGPLAGASAAEADGPAGGVSLSPASAPAPNRPRWFHSGSGITVEPTQSPCSVGVVSQAYSAQMIW